MTLPAWLSGAAAVDVLTARRRMPWVRLLSFATAWSWLESAGVAGAGVLWLTGRTDRADLHYELQRRWADALVGALRLCAGLRIEVDGLDALAPGPIVVCSRHANLADALLPAWLLGRVAMHPRYVLTDELLVDPCLDIVGNRLPNHFLERGATSDRELSELCALSKGMGAAEAAVIYPEGRLATEERRERRLAEMAERDPERARRLQSLRTLLPPKAPGTQALLAGARTADLVFLAHKGFDGLDRLTSAPAHVPFAEPVKIRLTRVSRAEIPEGPAFARWLDDSWLEMDEWVNE